VHERITLFSVIFYIRCHDVTETCHRFLDLTGPFQLGGLSVGHHSAARHRVVRSSGFVGCIRDLHIDGRLVDLASYVWNNGTVEGCAAKADSVSPRHARTQVSLPFTACVDNYPKMFC